MPQKLSAMRYIKNNKRRVSVLVISLGLCFVMNYLTQFLLSATMESFKSICMEMTRKIQYISLSEDTLMAAVNRVGAETAAGERVIEEDSKNYEKALRELAEKLKSHDGVKEVYCAQSLWTDITPPVAVMSYEMPLVEAEEIPVLLEHIGASLKEGCLPRQAGELVMDEASMKNNGYVLDGYFREESYGTAFKIVGVLACGEYFGCGIPADEISTFPMLAVLSDGIEDMGQELAKENVEVSETQDRVHDYKWGEKVLKEEVEDNLKSATEIMFAGILILLSLALVIVYTMYLRDRRDEWCLYSSIGFSRRSIYFSVMRELLFTFVAAVLCGTVIVVVAQQILNAVLIKPLGLKCRYFHPATIGELFCAYVLVLGILQIPIRSALYRIRTIDAMEDELY